MIEVEILVTVVQSKENKDKICVRVKICMYVAWSLAEVWVRE